MNEFVKILKFNKESNGKGYIDLPKWKGKKSALQMVCGADKILDIISNHSNSVEIFIHYENFDGASLLKKKRNCWFNGADYTIEKYKNNNINLKVWLRNVTKYVLGFFPDEIYFAKYK